MDTLAPVRCPARTQAEKIPQDAFHKLVADLSKILGPSSGLNSDDVDVDKLLHLMQTYVSDDRVWEQYAFSDLSRAYTRNLVDEGNGKSNLLILVWSPGQGSPIHDHANAHCLMKVLKGSLKEIRYKYPLDGITSQPQVIMENAYDSNQVTYMADELGLHKISNPDAENVAVSLHLYTLSNAAKEGCFIYNETTGKKSHVTQSNFYSVHGKKVESFQSMK